MITNSTCSAIVGDLLTKVRLKSTDNVSKQTKQHRLEKVQSDFNKVLDDIKSTMNSYAVKPDKRLYCLTTVCEISREIKDDL